MLAAGKNASRWNVPNIVEAAYRVAIASDDFSLVGLAARIKDPVVLAALRESVVLYAALAAATGMPSKPTYEWRVDAELATAANRFIEAFHRFVPNALLKAEARNAATFHGAFQENNILGRCVRIGYDDSVQPIRYYHWVIRAKGGQLDLHDFWSQEIWTTERYRQERP